MWLSKNSKNLFTFMTCDDFQKYLLIYLCFWFVNQTKKKYANKQDSTNLTVISVYGRISQRFTQFVLCFSQPSYLNFYGKSFTYNRNNYRGSRSQIYFKIGIFKNFVILTGKHLFWSLFLMLQKIFKKSFFREHLRRLLL